VRKSASSARTAQLISTAMLHLPQTTIRQKQSGFAAVCGESGNYWHLGVLLGVINNGHRPDGWEETRRWNIGGKAIHKRLEKAGERKCVTWEKDGQETLDGLPTADLPLYGAEHVRTAPPDADILVSEGEKKTDALLALGFTALGTVTGATGTPSVETLRPLAEHKARVFLCRDNDQAGRDHMGRIAARLKRLAKEAYLVDWPGVPEKGDAYDYIKAGRTAEDVRAVLAAAPLYQGEAEPEEQGTHFHLTDYGNAERLASLYGDIIRYSPERKAWLIWTGKVWEWDMGGVRIAKLAKKTARNIYREAADEPDDDLRKELVKHARATERQVRIDAMIKSAESEPGIAVSLADLDTNHWLLNVNNGTIDLRTGVLKPHDRADLITEILPIDYNLSATSTEWNAFLSRIFNDNADLIAYVQRALGYSITGDQSEQVFFFCYGSGFNGKSTLLNACRLVMGNYATQIPPTAFMVDKTKRGGPDEAIASLKNKRLVCSTELEDGQRLSVSLVKRMTGGEPLWCEHKFERGYNFQPTHKLWLSGNHEPIITDTTNSIWYRLKKIPFTIEIPETDRKKGYAEKLAAEHGAAILAWLARGCVEWRQVGSLGEPEAVKQAVAEYRDQQDVLHNFILERCHLERNAAILTRELWDDYKKWCAETDTYQLGQRKFYDRIREKGVIDERGARNKPVFRGIRLLKPEEDGVTEVTKVTEITESLLHEASTGKTLVKKGNLSNSSNSDKPDLATDTPSHPDILPDYTAALGMPVEDALTVWRSKGAPVIHVPDGNIFDLAKFLAEPGAPESHLEAVRTWLEKHTGGNGQC